MKIGDTVRSTKIRPNDTATIIKIDISKVYNEKKNRNEIRTTYLAEFPDKTAMTFYGFNIDKTIFKVMESDGQLCLSDFLAYPEEV